MEITAIIAGIAAGVSYALSGFIKTQGEKFDWLKFGSTTLLGGIAGLVMTLTTWDISVAYEYLISLGLVPLAENLLKFLYRKIFVPIYNKIMKIEVMPGPPPINAVKKKK